MTGRYETIVVGVPTLTEDEFGDVVKSLESTITEGKGTLIRTEPWGKKRLAYRVDKFDEGYYTLFFYESEPPVVKELERRIRMNDQMLRFITVKVDWEEKVAKAELLKATSRRQPRERQAEDVPFGDGEMDEVGDLGGGGQA